MNNLEQLADVAIPKKDKMHMARAGQLKMIKYNQIKLKEELEKYDFEQLADNTTEQEEKRRFLALSYLKNGKNIREVADAVKVSCSSINAWIRQFNKNKLEGLKKADRRKPHLEIYYSQKETFQKQNFQHLADNTTDQEEKRRLLALAYIGEGKSVLEVANALKVSYSSVYAWIRQFNKDNLEGIKKADRRKPHLEIYYSKKEELQQYDFEQLAKSATYENEKKHLLALACLKQGKSVVEISEALKMSQSTIYKLIRRFNHLEDKSCYKQLE